ncbi:MAG: hypothetical protein HY728_09280, partial [Candidatus Rokubacteria bacterium]|nr:hypothetical protein [Candidatus Rokubacteria bacterium]
IWKVGPTGGPVLVLRGGVPAGMALGPGGHLFVADRHAAKIFFLTPDGTPAEFIGFTEGDVPRSLGFAPITDATRRAGIAGDLFVVTIRIGTFRLNEIVRISGPFDRLVGAGGPDAR